MHLGTQQTHIILTLSAGCGLFCQEETYGGGVVSILQWKVETNLVGSERAARENFLSPQSGMNVFPLFPDTKQR